MVAVILHHFFGSSDEIWFIELTWTIIAAIGLAVSFYNLYQTWIDKVALKKAGIRNGRAFLARSALVSEALRTMIQFLFLWIGVWAVIFIPKLPTASLPLKYEIYSYASRYTFIIAALLLTLKTLVAWYTRKRIIDGQQKIIPGSGHQGTNGLDQTQSITYDPEH